MPELRKDPIVGRWVIIATDRAKRPVAPKGEVLAASEGFCPFCEGSEGNTPLEILSYRDRHTRPNEKGWRVRVVPNKFPALQIEGELSKRGEGIYDKLNGVGAHEVILECPFHEISMASLSEDVLRAIGHNRVWMKSYGVVVGLARNPKTPVALSLSLLSRLQNRDVQALAVDRNVPEPLRIAARKKADANVTGKG